MLASMWLEICGCSSAWISLDEGDNDMYTFLSYLLTALRSAFPTIEMKTQPILDTPNLPSASILACYLLKDLEQIKEPFILALDDTHRIQAQEVFDLLDTLLRHPHPSLHLLLISRQDPSLPIASLRARGQATEIRAQDLRFSVDETASLLQRMLQRQVDQRVAAEWTQSTEGWVTALRLAALSLRHHGQLDDLRVNIRGDSRYLQEYLLAEVLARLPKAEQTWLLKGAVLDRFCAPLCEKVCQTETDSSDLTGQLVGAGKPVPDPPG